MFAEPARATISGPSADSATGISPAAGAKISADWSSTSLVRSPAPSGVSVLHDSSFTDVFVPFTAIGDPDAGGSIHIELTAGRTGGANLSSTTMSALTF